MHLGHREILAQLTQAAQQRGLEPAVFTFTQNPLSLIAPRLQPQPLTSPAQRLEQLERSGIAATLMVDFDDRLRQLSPEAYVKRILVDLMRAEFVQVGEDFRFGQGGQGDAAELERLGKQLGFEVAVTKDVTVSGDRVSSSRIRELLGEGNVSAANRLLGRHLELRGTVVHGAKRGRELGFPTANLGDLEGHPPADGVYAGYATVAGKRHRAAISVGSNPTFTPDAVSQVEVHILDFGEDIYGEVITVAVTERIRPTLSFDSVDDLVAEMHRDVAKIHALLDEEER